MQRDGGEFNSEISQFQCINFSAPHQCEENKEISKHFFFLTLEGQQSLGHSLNSETGIHHGN